MPKFSGATQQSLAQLLDQQGAHKDIDGLYLRYEVEPMPTEANKMKKAIHLARVLSQRGDGSALNDLIEYIGRPGVGLGPAFQRGSQPAQDLYANYDRDLARGEPASSPPTASPQTPTSARARSFSRPGTTAPISKAAATGAPKRHVFIVRGRDNDAYKALVALLLALDLRIVTWDDAARAAGGGTPHTLDIVRAGIELSDAVVVLMTPDDLGQVKEEFFNPVRDDPREGRQTGQVRQNVVFEAGWAMALNQSKVILIRVGDVRPLSDIDGLNYVWLEDDISARRQLVGRLKSCELEVDDSGEEWRTAGAFPSHV